MSQYEEVKMPPAMTKRKMNGQMNLEDYLDEVPGDGNVFNNRFINRAGRPEDLPPGMKEVSKSHLKSVMRSKLDIYNILTKEGQLYMPPYNECSMQFINEIMMGKKKVRSRLLTHECVGLQERRDQDGECPQLRRAVCEVHLREDHAGPSIR